MPKKKNGFAKKGVDEYKQANISDLIINVVGYAPLDGKHIIDIMKMLKAL